MPASPEPWGGAMQDPQYFVYYDRSDSRPRKNFGRDAQAAMNWAKEHADKNTEVVKCQSVWSAKDDAQEAAPAAEAKSPLLGADLIVKFERIGRTGTTPEAALTVHIPANLTTDVDKIAHVLYKHCGRYLTSSDYDVFVDLTEGAVRISGGRFGKGTILAASGVTE